MFCNKYKGNVDMVLNLPENSGSVLVKLAEIH